jgi:hypothetical protein
MIRLALLATATAGLLIPAYLDDPSNYEHDALLPTTSAAAVTSTTGAVVVGTSEAPQATPTTSTTVTTTARLQSTVPATSIVILSDAKCPEWSGYAAIYFDADELEIVDRIMWQESRCQPDVISRTNDYGLMQINWAVWGDTINSQGFSQDDLLDPSVNMMWAFLIAHEAERIGWCTWQPWYMSGDWCS